MSILKKKYCYYLAITKLAVALEKTMAVRAEETTHELNT